MRNFIFLYGPPGTGKSTIGRWLSDHLGLRFIDLDLEIERYTEMTVQEIFFQDGESGFRAIERSVLKEILAGEAGVIALGGGSLLDIDSRREVEAAGCVICLTAPKDILLSRLSGQEEARPLLAGDRDGRLQDLLARREGHYASFDYHLDTTRLHPDQLVHAIQLHIGEFHLSGMGKKCAVIIKSGGLDCLGRLFVDRGMEGPVVLVSDENVGSHYAKRAGSSLYQAGYAVELMIIPAGEASKTLSTSQSLWDAFLKAGLDRGSTVISLGGGVVGDLVGFAAATYMRGVSWILVPTSLLAMVDASIGGKTGINLPQGKNLIGAFHSPALVLIDPDLLNTLPDREKRSGLAEVVKHGLIGDTLLYEQCAEGELSIQNRLDEVIRRAVAVKVQIVENDPYEAGQRMVLNLGHTIGHAIEMTSGYALRHGEAIAIGLVKETQLAERLQVAEKGLAKDLERTLSNLGLPTEIPVGLDHEVILKAIRVDKKSRGGKVFLPLPVRVGETRSKVEVKDIRQALIH